MIGTSLNQYRITASIGAGGMGEVFRARDTRLNRDVAVKVLPRDFVADADRLRRFEQEAKTLAALNHPNVLTVFDAGVHEGEPYLVSELLEGKTLREEMNGGVLPVRKASEYALQIAHGLAAANGKGVIHRDLKPENIFVTKDGRVKILDFGLAKLRNPSPALRAPSPLGGERDGVRGEEAETIINTTEPGMVLGTPAYMSPEQVRGESADHRADIFAFGCVLYEMLSGTRAFRRNTPVESMSAVLNDTPPELSTTHPNVPIALQRLVERCLEKQPDNRFQSAKDLAFAIEAARDQSSPAPGGRQRDTIPHWRGRRVTLAITVILTACLVGLILKLTLHRNQQTNESPNTSAPPREQLKSIAVLPFVNMSSDKENEYLSDGISEDLCTALTQVRGLRVPARTSCFVFKGKTDDIQKIGQQLHVANVLEGSVSQSGNKLRISAQLISVADGFHLWATNYDREMSDLLALRSEIAQQVVAAMRVQLLPGEKQQIEQPPTRNAPAYDLYLRGRFFADRRNRDALNKAIDYFQQTIVVDPNFARAYGAMANCYLQLMTAGAPATEAIPKAKEAAQQALAIDAGTADAHACMGLIKMNYEWDLAGAEKEFLRAIQSDPNYPPARYWYAFCLTFLGQGEAALAAGQRAVEIDPASSIALWHYGTVHYHLRRYDQAIRAYQQALEVAPDDARTHFYLSESYRLEGSPAKAFAELLKVDSSQAPALTEAYRTEGMRGCARVELKWSEENEPNRIDVTYVPRFHVQLSENQRALDRIEKAFGARAYDMMTIKVDPAYDPLRSEPRFLALLKKMGLDK